MFSFIMFLSLLETFIHLSTTVLTKTFSFFFFCSPDISFVTGLR